MQNVLKTVMCNSSKHIDVTVRGSSVCIFHFYFALQMYFLNGMMVWCYRRERIVTGAEFNLIDTRLHPDYDGNDVGGTPPTLFLVFISNDSRDKSD